MGTVSKSDIVREIAQEKGVTQDSVRAAIDAFLGAVTQHAHAGDTVSLSGFGRFQVKARPARTGRNPATGATVEIPESRKLAFKVSKTA